MKSVKFVVLSTVIWAVATQVSVAADSKTEVLWSRVFVKRDSGDLEANVYRPRGKGPFPGMLVVHGGAWTMGSRIDLAAVASALAERDYVAVAIDYRLAPKYKFPAQIYDCQAAVRWMRQHASELKIDPARIGGFGYSAGGHLVALLGTIDDKKLREPGVPADAPSTRLQVVIAGGAPCDFRPIPERNEQLAFWLGGPRILKQNAYRDASPANFITPDDSPMYFFHGELDLLVPIESPQRMVKSLKDAGVTTEMYTVKNAGHVQALFDREALERGLAFADRYLKNDNTQLVRSTKPERAGPSPSPTEKPQTGGGQ